MKTGGAELYEKLENLMVQLYSRWQSEREYENINDYVAPLSGILASVGAVDVKMQKRPFGLRCRIGAAEYLYTISATRYKYRRIA